MRVNIRNSIKAVLGAVLLAYAATTVAAPKAVVLFDDRTITLQEVLADPNDLWVPTTDLLSVNGFELKPEGACLDEICVPVKRGDAANQLISRSDKDWFNVSELARRLRQPVAADHDHNVWSLGPIPASRARFENEHVAPEFALNDVDGNTVRLSDFKGKKVMLLTWASW